MPTPSSRVVSPVARLAALAALATLAALAACAPRPRTPPAAPAPTPAPTGTERIGTGLPPVPRVTGALDPKLVWPPENHTLAQNGRDSTFVFGSVGSGDAELAINGVQVPVAPNGAFVTFLPVPPTSAPRYELVATRGADTARRAVPIRVVSRRPLPAEGRLVVDSGSVAPGGRRVLRGDELVRVTVRAPRNAAVWLQLPPPDALAADTAARRAARAETPHAETPRADSPQGDRVPMVDALAARGIAPTPGPDASTTWVVEVPAAALAQRDARGRVIVARGRDTVSLPVGRVENVGAAAGPVAVGGRRFVQLGRPGAVPDTDRVVIGRPTPDGTYKWFFLPGTVVETTGSGEGMTRVRLDRDLEVWVADADAVALPAGYSPPPRVIGAARLVPTPESVDLQLALAERPAYEVVERGRDLDLILYGTVVSPEILPIIGNDTLVRQVVWRQEASDRARITLRLSRDPYGYQVLWEPSRGGFVLRVRRPPVIADPRRPLAGLTLVVDPGHPPGGATGPTGLTEPVAVLPVAERVRALLQERGATVIMTRTGPEAVPLGDRPIVARRANAHAFLSVHLNAFGDGVNPFANAGTSTLFFHQHAEPLARLVQREMVRRFQVRDLGVHYQNLAVARPPWVPAVLTEGLFLMFPEQEAAMRSAEGRELYAQAIVAGVEAWFRSLAEGR